MLSECSSLKKSREICRTYVDLWEARVALQRVYGTEVRVVDRPDPLARHLRLLVAREDAT